MYFSHEICKVQSFQSIFLSLSNERNVSLAVISIIIRTERYIAVPVQFEFFFKRSSQTFLVVPMRPLRPRFGKPEVNKVHGMT